MSITLIATVVSATAGFGLAWSLQAHQITKLELNHAQERIEIQRAARKVADRASTAVIVAQNNAQTRAVVLRRELDSVRGTVDGLRQSSDAAVRAATADAEACNRVVAAYSVIFTESTGFIQEVVGDVGRCGSAFQTLDEAWPK